MAHVLGLYTDLYEIRMVESYLRRDMTADATFSLYIRPTPERPWFVALGVGRVLELLADLRYGPDEISYLRSVGVDEATLDWLASFEPSGQIRAVPDGTVVLAEEPVLEMTAPLPVAQLLETAVINLIQHSTLVATKAARIALAARGRPVVDFGFRRAHGLETGVEAGRAAYVGGVMSTSNLEAGRRYAIPVAGTMAHSFVQAFGNELDAFRAFAADHPDNTVLLVDTYDTTEGVRNAIVVADEMLVDAIRIDSGDLDALSRLARTMLDQAGHNGVRIFASGGLEELRIAKLVDAGAPIDAFGVGTDLVVSADRPALDIAYKLVEYGGRASAKWSTGKASLPGAKQVFRDGSPERDVLGLRDERLTGTPLLEPVWRDGARLRAFDLEDSRKGAELSLGTLPEAWRRPPYTRDPPRPALSDALRELAQRVTR